MDVLILVLAVIGIALVFLAKFFNFSVIFPTLLILIAILLDIIYKIHISKKENKEFYNYKSKITYKDKDKRN